MKTLRIALFTAVFTLFCLDTHAQQTEPANDLLALSDNNATEKKEEKSTPKPTGSFISISSDHISNDTFLSFSDDLIGRKFHLIDSNDDIFLTKRIISVGMGIDMDALDPGQYFVVSKSKSGVISTSFLVD